MDTKRALEIAKAAWMGQVGSPLASELGAFERGWHAAVEYLTQREYVVCTYCTGTGMAPGSTVTACLRCNGAGKVKQV